METIFFVSLCSWGPSKQILLKLETCAKRKEIYNCLSSEKSREVYLTPEVCVYISRRDEVWDLGDPLGYKAGDTGFMWLVKRFICILKVIVRIQDPFSYSIFNILTRIGDSMSK